MLAGLLVIGLMHPAPARAQATSQNAKNAGASNGSAKAALTHPSPTAREAVARLIDLDAFFEKLDLSRPGLEAVRNAVQANDFDRAKQALLQYYREREGTYHFFDPDKPRTYTDNVSSRLRAADRLLQRKQKWDAAHWNDDTFQWAEASFSRKWRMYSISALGEAVALENDRRLAEALLNVLGSFVRQYPRPDGDGGPWQTMRAGIRMRTGWPVAFLALTRSKALTADELVLFLHSVWQQTHFIRENRSNTSNWLTFEMAGLYTSGVVYPEFKEARAWRRVASETALKEMKRGWLPDGMTIELSPGYGQFFSNYFLIYELAKHVGRLDEFGLGAFPSRTEKIYESYLKIMTPNRDTPATNDNRPANVREILRNGLKWFPKRQDFQWVAHNGKQGQKPGFTSTMLPYAGFAAMRSGWQRDDHMLYFDFGPAGYRHVHQDGLGVTLWAYGREILFDPGLGGYDPTNPYCQYARDTFSHNTVLVDDRPQRRPWYNKPHPRRMPYKPIEQVRWKSTERFDLAYGVYDDAYGLAGFGASDPYPYSDGSTFKKGWGKPAQHHRRVLFMKPDVFLIADTMVPKQQGKQNTYEARWHLSSTKIAKRDNGLTVATADKGRPNLEVAPLLTEGLKTRTATAQKSPEKLGWSAFDPDNPKPATTVQHIKQGSGVVQFLTLLMPLKEGTSGLLASKQRINDEKVRLTLKDGRRLVVSVPRNPQYNVSARFQERQ
jgi:hypothetical protein